MLEDPLSLLCLYGLWVIVTMVAQVLAAAAQVGLVTLSYPRDNMPPLTGVAGRLERALRNSVVALALVAPPVLVLALRAPEGLAPAGAVTLAMQVFLVSRILFVPVYAAGIPFLRTLIWAAGFIATLWLYLQAL
ncbi:MAPEG family protein [Roseivivax jejudonensis]|uniref:MAPEG family protein n=1 Tax=Roseivivax jejudonensis TaxID=1529041 RepID=A0A1X6ZRD5_9RHOB|nr:MAPEG family protein [Roseivivax jejudonensis]SLN59276.1 MAPEG family protein [Roseivivax jejudonensis]